MPLFDFQCDACGSISELLMIGSSEKVVCSHCGSKEMRQLLSAHSSLSGKSRQGMPGSGDTTCCGSTPGEKSGCAGPGSCCGKLG